MHIEIPKDKRSAVGVGCISKKPRKQEIQNRTKCHIILKIDMNERSADVITVVTVFDPEEDEEK